MNGGHLSMETITRALYYQLTYQKPEPVKVFRPVSKSQDKYLRLLSLYKFDEHYNNSLLLESTTYNQPFNTAQIQNLNFIPTKIFLANLDSNTNFAKQIR
jgi:hypothetical protein